MDPYKVLGVTRTATDEHIKSAYRKLAKKYHPDQYRGHDLEDLANEKIKEINLAYEMIQNERSLGGTNNVRDPGSSYSGQSGSNYAGYAKIRSMIQIGNVSQAEAMLDAINNHDAEWHYLKGVILQRKGWYDGARQHFSTAYTMNPNNPEYSSAWNNVNKNATSYAQTQYGNQQSGAGGCSVCNICTGLLCADCCCDCAGGGGCC
jgi:molecular chaperone DnaJ